MLSSCEEGTSSFDPKLIAILLRDFCVNRQSELQDPNSPVLVLLCIEFIVHCSSSYSIISNSPNKRQISSLLGGGLKDMNIFRECTALRQLELGCCGPCAVRAVRCGLPGKSQSFVVAALRRWTYLVSHHVLHDARLTCEAIDLMMACLLPWDSRLIKGRHNGGLIYFGSSYNPL